MFGDGTRAAAAFEKARSLAPDYATSQLRLATTLEKQKQYDEAITIAKAQNNSVALASYKARQQKADALALATPTTNAPTVEATSEATADVTVQPEITASS